MSAVQRITEQLMDYFACVGHPGRVFGPRDFNSQVMNNVFDAESRGALGIALQQLAEAGVLEAASPIAYTLTGGGFAMARRLRDGDRGAARGTVVGVEA